MTTSRLGRPPTKIELLRANRPALDRIAAAPVEHDEHPREQMNDNAAVYDEVVALLEADPMGELGLGGDGQD